MTIIIPTKGNATSSMLEIWQSHIQQQQADKAQAAAKTAGTASTVNQAAATKSTGADDAAKLAQANASTSSDAAESNGVSQLGDKTLVDLRSANQSAKQQGQAMTETEGAGSGNEIVAQTIKKLKEMLAKVMKQLDAVRTNDRLPPEDKLQQMTMLSSQAMSIQAQILALMGPAKPTGNNVDTTA
ncbi:hypothetical protein PAN31117_03219 [Pandoraea anapnoica]|uniref:Uncharacterized protein n=1 Tax=Pandoraea anapnoica TaxID=2508301 RepID=A0A5E5A5Y7_9BURK|nr:FlxA-like family protein [Pandoraea anapnoica]VVE69071.1 hypothetical protein PAN31117_03219 [Pandoraea anapnoica]